MHTIDIKKTAFLVLVLSFILINRALPVTIDAVSTNAGDAVSFTHSHTVSGTDRLLVVAVETDNGRTASTVTYAGQPLSLVSGLTHAGGRPRVEIWRFINPPVGTNNVVVNISGGADKVTIGAISYTGVNQTVPIDGITSVQGASTNPSVAVPSQANDLVQDAMASIAAGLPTVGSGQTQRWNLEMGGPGVSNHYGTGSTEPGASLVAMNWTISEIREWVIIGFNVKSGSVNQPPVLDSIGPKSVAEGSNLTFRVHGTDPDGDSVILTIVNAPTNSNFLDSGNGAGSFSFNPSFVQTGIYNVTFRASDGSLLDSEVVQITVTEAGNQAPVLDSVGSKNVAEGSNLTFRVHASDADGDSLILTVPNLPANAVFIDSANGAGSFSFSPDYTQSGLIPVTFKASDGTAVDSEIVDITVSNICLAKSGDANNDNQILLSDIVRIINFLFKGTPAPVPYCRGDANASGTILLSDIVYLVNFLFKSGPAPVPHLECCL